MLLGLRNGQAVRRSLRCFQSSAQPLARLVCFSWAGGGAAFYRRFAGLLPEGVELYAVQLPGREDRFAESRLLRMEQVVQHVVSDVLSISSCPLVLFGHSMGALVAYEVTQSLVARAGLIPQLLIVSGSNAPGVKGGYQRCPSNADAEVLREDIRQLGGTPDEILQDVDLLQALLPVIRADYEVLDTYRAHTPVLPLSCPIIACTGRQDHSVSASGIAAWQQYTRSAFMQEVFEGDHFYLSVEPQPLLMGIGDWILRECDYEACIV